MNDMAMIDAGFGDGIAQTPIAKHLVNGAMINNRLSVGHLRPYMKIQEVTLIYYPILKIYH